MASIHLVPTLHSSNETISDDRVQAPVQPPTKPGILIHSSPSSHPLIHSLSAPMSPSVQSPHSSRFNTFPAASQPTTPSRRTTSFNNAPAAPPRTLSIRFAPLPDPRAIRPLVTNPGVPCVWWTREERPDGTWGEYRLVVKNANGQIVPVDDLQDPQERKVALEAHELLNSQSLAHLNPSEQAHLSASSQSASSLVSSDGDPCKKPLDNISISFTLNASQPHYDQRSPNSHPDHPSLVSPSIGSPSGLPLYRTTSVDTLSNISSSSVAHSDPLHRKHNFSSSLTKKLKDVMKKPLRGYSSRLTLTASLPIDSHPAFGAPLTHTRSAESTSSKRYSFRSSLNPSLRRTQSKDERPSSCMMMTRNDTLAPVGDDRLLIPLEVERTRRRAKYPPVAQRKVHMGGSRGGAGKLPLVDEPAFVEWGAPSSVALVNALKAKNSGQQLDKEDGGSIEDDGSGMAWLKKRKKEREERARREAEEQSRSSVPPLEVATHSTTASQNSETWAQQHDQTQSQSSDSSDDRVSEPSVRDQVTRTASLDSRSRRSSNTTNSSQKSGCLPDQVLSSNESSESRPGAQESKDEADEEDLNEEELQEEERLKAKALIESPFLRGAKEVFKDREHHRVLKT